MAGLMDLFEAGKCGRILFEVGPRVLDFFNGTSDVEEMSLVAELYEMHCATARQAVDCWSTVGRRLGVRTFAR